MAEKTDSDVDPSSKKCDELMKEEEIAQLAKDYAEYVKIDTSKQKDSLVENVEDMLTRLDEFCTLVDMIRGDSTLCLNRTLPGIYAKSQDLEEIFDRIDQLEAFVAVVKKDVNLMEEHVNRAEEELGSFSLKKVFTSIPMFKANKSAAATKTDKKVLKYEPPEIYHSSDYFCSEIDHNTEMTS